MSLSADKSLDYRAEGGHDGKQYIWQALILDTVGLSNVPTIVKRVVFFPSGTTQVLQFNSYDSCLMRLRRIV
ncbi:hypothetical protein CCP2SC5_1900004 [Azospirillaceae bacterium]